ncbi:hypothetical protein FJT64_012294 [Amphibalanus amphitrite]|uniref:Uncharacterized protein n=1 Tax=Amphibalanus amphitrite TaxID=1232801 RepID=A0A6A4VG37_AMPAM|nr:hypothetical protein FJT64_012294 [Amphibalanus amphitrite]
MPMYGMQGFSLPTMPLYGTPGVPAPDGSAQPDQQQLASYQRMFMQSALAQNMQIQQQLFSQNQALAQLLQASTAPQSGIPPAPPMAMTPEEMAAFMDPSYTRARTVRIGKWRWPPPKGEAGAAADFLQFKLQAQQRKLSSGQKSGSRPATDTSFEGVEWDEFEMETADAARAPSTPENLNKSRESAKSVDRELNKQPKEKSEAAVKLSSSAPNSISKLKISSALKMKLEAVTSKHTERTNGSTDSKDTPDGGRQKVVPKKLDMSRRLLLQQQLGSAQPAEKVTVGVLVCVY